MSLLPLGRRGAAGGGGGGAGGGDRRRRGGNLEDRVETVSVMLDLSVTRR